MSLYKVEVTRVIRSSKPFVVEAENDKDAEKEAIEAACQAEELEEGVDGWVENLEWLAETLYHEPRVGDTVRYAAPNRGEEHFRFRLLERSGNEVLIELICPFTIKPTERIRADQICLAE